MNLGEALEQLLTIIWGSSKTAQITLDQMAIHQFFQWHIFDLCHILAHSKRILTL